MQHLIDTIRQCKLCEEELPCAPRPVVQLHAEARILIAGQAPGRKAHDSGIPFDDASGARLREWLGVSSETFYDPRKFAILPMGFCYPGKGSSGDSPPLKRCADTWREQVLAQLKKVQLTVLLGNYAMRYHLPDTQGSLSDIVQNWRSFAPAIFNLPHPSPRNTPWLVKHPWFETEVLPTLRKRVAELV